MFIYYVNISVHISIRNFVLLPSIKSAIRNIWSFAQLVRGCIEKHHVWCETSIQRYVRYMKNFKFDSKHGDNISGKFTSLNLIISFKWTPLQFGPTSQEK